ncbi:YebG family protein [Gallaecimonas kandeliae]|uniref:YebG family protein n=1 Tax=Gallaecimonas kandeliae TaxID=3029055 RepID=UPI0026483918|nr:YebG family protein [Gallaecimonas kandeliae]WKE67375.1 YebG family protein [Gallaecimonas kandeliae]
MAVVIQYVVVRKGIEKMTFTSKQEADAYDKLLDSAEVLAELLEQAPVELSEEDREQLGLFLATEKEQVLAAFKGKVAPKPSKGKKEST